MVLNAFNVEIGGLKQNVFLFNFIFCCYDKALTKTNLGEERDCFSLVQHCRDLGRISEVFVRRYWGRKYSGGMLACLHTLFLYINMTLLTTGRTAQSGLPLNWDVDCFLPFHWYWDTRLLWPHLDGLWTGTALAVLSTHLVDLSYKTLRTVKNPSCMTSPWY